MAKGRLALLWLCAHSRGEGALLAFLVSSPFLSILMRVSCLSCRFASLPLASLLSFLEGEAGGATCLPWASPLCYRFGCDSPFSFV